MRLTNAIRRRIVQAVVEHGTNTRTGELELAQFRLARIVYDRYFGADVQSAMSDLPHFCVKSYKDFEVLTREGHRLILSLSTAERFPDAGSSTFQIPLNLDRRGNEMKNHDLEEEVRKYQRTYAKLEEDKKMIRDEASKIVNASQTTNTLFERWPELKPIVPSELLQEETYAVVAPAAVKKLNRLLGLKSGTVTVN